jgi:hypothetical protein
LIRLNSSRGYGRIKCHSTDTIFSAQDEDYPTLSHEIGHILMDSKEHPNGNEGTNIVNLMAVPYQAAGLDTDSRRITSQQAEAMFTERPNLLRDP